jgi:hypothetical protein
MSQLWKRGTGLGDARLDQLAAAVMERIVETHSLVMTKLGAGRAGEVGAGRLLKSKKVDVEGLLAPHVARTADAVRGRRIVAAQDTTEINFAGRDKRRRGLGPAGDGVSKGFFIHPVVAIDADEGALLGVAGAQIWTRDAAPVPDHHGRAFEDKESVRWLRGAEQAADRLAAAASVIVIGDRESDIYELFARRPGRADLIIRMAQDRALKGGGKLFDTSAGFAALGTAQVSVAPKGVGDKGRTACVTLRAGQVEIRRSKKTKAAGNAAWVALGLVEAIELDPPVGIEPLNWRLATTLPVATPGEAAEIVRLYRLRWRIEEVFRALKKDGLRLEETQVTGAAAVMKLAALGLVAAARIVQLVDARDGSVRPATDVIDPGDIEAVDRISASREGKTDRQKNPWPKGSLAWTAWVVARLGGWNCYYRPPGPKTMADGWRRLAAMLDGFKLATATQDV